MATQIQGMSRNSVHRGRTGCRGHYPLEPTKIHMKELWCLFSTLGAHRMLVYETIEVDVLSKRRVAE